jgi:hypothetical protein
MAPGQFGLCNAIASLGHALHLGQGQPAPEALGMAQQLDPVGGPTLDQRTIQRFPQETDQCPSGQWRQGMTHAEKWNPDIALK